MRLATLRTVGSVLVFLHGAQALASGYLLPRATTESLGMADANVALAHGAGAQFINPAGLAQPDSGWVAGLLTGCVNVGFTRANTMGAAAAGEYDAEPQHPIVPTFAAGLFVGELALGLSLEASHGTSIEWPDHAWEAALGPTRVDLAHRAEFSSVRFGPALAWNINNAMSIGARVFGQRVSASEESDLYKVEGDGTTIGYQVGLRYRGERFALGSAYTSRTNTNIEGSLGNVHPALAGSLTPGAASAHILLPDRLQTGVAFRLAPDLWWEVDADWIGWSYVDQLTIYQANGTIANAGKNARHNEDTWSYRTGLKWRARPELTLHAGLGYDPSPVPDRDVSPTTSFLGKQRVGVGAVYAQPHGLELGVAYQFVYGPQRTVGETDLDNLGASDTNVFEGSYKSRTHSLGLTLAGRF